MASVSAPSNSQPFNALTQDVNEIYSKKDPTTKRYTRVYSFENNQVSIVFQRVWKNQAAECGIDMRGSAEITIQKRDSDLEKKITEIIQQPNYRTMAGKFPIVYSIWVRSSNDPEPDFV
jgi:hypothetical protein